ncbi:MAG: hypothetical protein FWG83_08130 [Oscillospiraceae bacterium]|nr:hypothetical protein [Oscillospiraceae bacterium]
MNRIETFVSHQKNWVKRLMFGILFATQIFPLMVISNLCGLLSGTRTNFFLRAISFIGTLGLISGFAVTPIVMLFKIFVFVVAIRILGTPSSSERKNVIPFALQYVFFMAAFSEALVCFVVFVHYLNYVLGG